MLHSGNDFGDARMEPQTGLMEDPSMPIPPATSADPTMVPHAFGMVPMESLAQIAERERQQASVANNRPFIQGLAGYVRECWSAAWNAKRTTGIEERMLRAVRQRRGVYDPDIMADIKKTGGSEIYMMLTSNKCRAAASWIRDVLLGTRDEKPWTIKPTPIPEMPPEIAQSLYVTAQQEVQTWMQATGEEVGQQDMQRIMEFVYDRAMSNARQRAKDASARVERKMEDQLIEGKFHRALGEFIEDLVTFPAAIIKGPVVRRKPKMTWESSAASGYQLKIVDEYLYEWDRVDPFMAYPAPHCTNIDDGFFIERHRLTRSQLSELKGVEGYSTEAINTVLLEHGRGGLHEWLFIDSAKAHAEGKSTAGVLSNPEATIDALQFWGSVQGKMLIDWGLGEDKVDDPTKEYPCEVWLIGQWVIKAVVNPDPLGRKPYYKASYEEIPGVFWGNGVTDLCYDAQIQCNTAARAIANNMGIASGPQVGVNVDRLPTGEDLTQIYPWKIWQFTSDPFGSTAQPINFFVPPLIAGELMQIYKFFSDLADEHTGIPRYMAGDASGSGALRTSSGMSMLMNNAGKAIKQVISNIDVNVMELLIERLHFSNMMWGDDPELKNGDVKIVARGAASLIAKEAQQQRMNEFMQIILNSPQIGQIVGEEALIDMVRENAKTIGMEDHLPPAEVIRARLFQMRRDGAAAQKAERDFQINLALAPSREVEVERGPMGEVLGVRQVDKQPHVMPAQAPMASFDMGGVPGQGSRTMSTPNQTTGGVPITDHFSPMRR